MRWSGILGLVAAATSSAVMAATDELPSAEKITAVAAKTQWAHLLHYRHHPFTLRYQSQNDSPEFFLAKEGKTDLKAELRASVQAFSRTGAADNLSAQCRFPARYQWVKEQFPEISFSDQSCSEFSDWKNEIGARYLTLIFPASHINSPSSMYGHTLVRMDTADQNSSKLLSYSVNFAANADPSDNELVFSYKGLTGGYPGVVSVMPYYQKTNEYQHLEYRDIWEYELDLTPKEVDQFVRHVWETKDSYFDYYFFDENCSYRLLALLDASSERSDLAKHFNFTAVPVDTIRVMDEAGLITKTHYRASAASGLEYKSQQSSEQVLETAKALVDSDADIEQLLENMSEREQVRALELAHAYARYLAIKKKQDNPVLRKRTIGLLSARAKRPTDAEFIPAPTPQLRDDEGHYSARVGGWLGAASDEVETRAYTDLSLRLAYHDVMDLPEGFVPGSQIQMGEFDLRIDEEGDTDLQRFTVIDVLSLSHQTYFQSPVAWAVKAGFERPRGFETEMYGYVKAAFGRAYLTDIGRFYGLADIQLLTDDQFDKGYQLSIGPRLGWLLQGAQVQAQIEANLQEFNQGDETQRRQVTAELGYKLDRNLQLRLKAQWHQYERDEVKAEYDEVATGLYWYY